MFGVQGVPVQTPLCVLLAGGTAWRSSEVGRGRAAPTGGAPRGNGKREAAWELEFPLLSADFPHPLLATLALRPLSLAPASEWC